MKRILITGGTGFLGRILVEHFIQKNEIERIVIFSRRWNDQEKMQLQYRDDPSGKKLRFITGDIRDLKSLTSAMRGIDTVIHAAAYKHVSFAEYNPREVISVNIDGSQNVIDAAIENGVEQVLAISSDKAVDAYNLYGKTKAVMESMMVAANNLGSTRFNVARYGNVWGSTGSVIEIWTNEITKDRPVLNITSKDMTRFFIFRHELLNYMDVCLTGIGLARGLILLPKMKAIDINSLASIFIKLPKNKTVETSVSGVRPGEKLHESLISDHEEHNARVIINPSEDVAAIFPPDPPMWGKSSEVISYPVFLSDYRSNTATRLDDQEIFNQLCLSW